jgi:uncharacterized protein YutE (UPF0331/DUF86 family)
LPPVGCTTGTGIGSHRDPTRKLNDPDPTVLDKIREHRNIVSFRNILAHGYDSIDNRIVWGIIEEDLGKLLEDVERLLAEEDRTSGCT